MQQQEPRLQALDGCVAGVGQFITLRLQSALAGGVRSHDPIVWLCRAYGAVQELERRAAGLDKKEEALVKREQVRRGHQGEAV